MSINFSTSQSNVSFQGYSSFKKRVKSFFNFRNNSETAINPVKMTPPAPPVDTFESSKQVGEVVKSDITLEKPVPFDSIADKSWDLQYNIPFEEHERLERRVKSHQNARCILGDKMPRYLNSRQLQLTYKLLNNEDALQNDLVKKYARDLIVYSDIKIATKFANAILTNQELYCNEYVMKNSKTLIRYLNPITESLIDRILSTPDLYNNKDIMDSSEDMLRTVYNKEAASIVDKILSNEKLYNNKYAMHTSFDNMRNNSNNIQEQKNAKIQFINKYLSADLLYKNESISKEMGFLIWKINTQETADNVNSILDKFISDPQLHGNENISKNLHCIIHCTAFKDSVKPLIDKILSNEKLYNQKYLMDVDNFSEFIHTVTTTSGMPSLVSSMLDKILEKPAVFNNSSIQESLPSILRTTTSSDSKLIKTKILDKFSTSEELQNNKIVSINIGKMLTAATNLYQYEFVNKILDDEKLYNNENIMNNISKLLYELHSQKLAEVSLKILDDESLYNNESFMNNLFGVYKAINFNSLKDVKASRLSVLEQIVDDKNLHNNKYLINNMKIIIEDIYRPLQAVFLNKVFSNFDKLNSSLTWEWVRLSNDLDTIDDSNKLKFEFYNSIVDEILNNSEIKIKDDMRDIVDIIRRSKSVESFKSSILLRAKPGFIR